MDSDVIKTFNKTLISMQECKGGVVSKQKVVEITKAAMNAIRYFKHVVFIIERYLAKCRPEFKIPCLYVMDSILRQAKKQYKHKDVFAPRFAVNLSNTIRNILDCESSERPKVVRVINLWHAHQVFQDDVIQPLLRHCQASGLETNPVLVEQLVKGDKADMQLYTQQPGSAERGQQDSTSAHNANANIRTPTIPAAQSMVPPAPAVMRSGSFGNGQPRTSLDERLSQFSRQKLGFGRSSSITTTPKTVESSGPKTPPMEDQDHRPSQAVQAEQPAGPLTEQDIIQLLNPVGVQFASMKALENLQQFLNGRLQEQVEIEQRRKGNITNILARDFDYSDEEEESAPPGGGNALAGSESPKLSLSSMPKEMLLTIARSLVTDPAMQQEIRRLASGNPIQPAAPKFVMPDFSVPPPNFNGLAAGAPPGMFLPKNPPIFGGAFPPQQPTLFKPTSPPPQHEQREKHGRSGGDSSSYRDRRDSHGGSDRSLGRKRTREWSRSPDERKEKHRSSYRRDEKPSSSRRRDGDRERGRRRSRSGSPARYERDREKEKEREQQERERRRVGLPSKPKADHVLIASRTLWIGKMPMSVATTEQDIIAALKDADAGSPEKVAIVAKSGCCYVTMPDRKSAYKVRDRLVDKIQIQKKNVKLDWSKIPALMRDDALPNNLNDYWDMKRGYAEIPYYKLPDGNVDKLMEGAWLELDTLPAHLKDRYTNTGLKNQPVQQQPQIQAATIALPQGIALPPMPAQMPPQMMPMFNQALMTIMANQMQAAPFLFPPPVSGAGALPQIPVPTQPQPQNSNATGTPTKTPTADGFANAGFGNSGFASSGGAQSGHLCCVE